MSEPIRERTEEQITSKVSVLEKLENGTIRFEAVVSEADFINGNRRMYPMSVLADGFERLNQRLQEVTTLDVGTVDHPDDPDDISLSDLGIIWEHFKFEGTTVVGVGRAIPTTKGRDLIALLEAGVRVGFSTRGIFEWEERVIDDRLIRHALSCIELEGVDAVVRPSVKHARSRAILKEEEERMDKEERAKLESERDTAASRASEAESKAQRLQEQLDAVLAERDALKADAAVYAAERAKVALSNKVIELVGEHRFAESILAEIKELGEIVTLENAETIVSRVTALVENIAVSASVAERSVEPNGQVDNESQDNPPAEKTQEQLAIEEELRAAGIDY